MNHPIYPIYSRSVSVYEPIPDDKLTDEWFLKMQHPTAKGFYRNIHMFYNQMFKEDPGLDFVLNELKTIWQQKKVEHLPEDMQFKVEKIDEEEWCLTWFAHHTFDIGQSNEEVLDSFENFLRRKGVMPNYGYDPYYSQEDHGYCAMGAEDMWRWCGRKTPDCNSELTRPPCRCDGCKKRGVITIQH
jgi:hypothetical protein